MNLDELTVMRAGKPIRLNPMMFKILRMLMHKSPSVVTRDEMEHELWDQNRSRIRLDIAGITVVNITSIPWWKRLFTGSIKARIVAVYAATALVIGLIYSCCMIFILL